MNPLLQTEFNARVTRKEIETFFGIEAESSEDAFRLTCRALNVPFLSEGLTPSLEEMFKMRLRNYLQIRKNLPQVIPIHLLSFM